MKNFSEIPWDKLNLATFGEEWLLEKDAYGYVLVTNGEKYKFPDALSVAFIGVIEMEKRVIQQKILSVINY